MTKRLAAESKSDHLAKELEKSQQTVYRLRKKGGDVESHEHAEAAPEAPRVEEQAPAAEVKQHARSITDRFCPECGDENPDFKDEAWCVDCSRPLGAKDNLPKLKACPNCGSKSATSKKPAAKIAWLP